MPLSRMRSLEVLYFAAESSRWPQWVHRGGDELLFHTGHIRLEGCVVKRAEVLIFVDGVNVTQARQCVTIVAKTTPPFGREY